MKIGILTYWWTDDNYGQLLQAYALQTYLKKKGHDVFLIKYQEKKILKKKSFIERLSSITIEKILKKIESRKIKLNKKRHPRFFEDFKREYLVFSDEKYDSYLELQSSPPNADLYICGSDQVWNSKLRNPIEPYLLSFGNTNTKRASYAASFGLVELSDVDKIIYKRCLAVFDAISVRERTGVDICNQLGYTNVYWLADPTLLLNINEWLAISKKRIAENKDKTNVFVYTLNETIEDKTKVIEYFKEKKNTVVNHVTANNDISGNVYPTIHEWITSINEADFVITNSFHGLVFCIIFNKNFLVLPTTKSFIGMNDRVDSLLYKCDLKDNILTHFDEAKLELFLNKKIDWKNTNDNIKEWLKESDAFFDDLLK